VVNDAKRQGRVRRLALEVVERLRPGTTDRLTPGWLDDPEFNYEAVAALIQEADRLDKDGKKEESLAVLKKAFGGARDVGQTQTLVLRLKNLGVTVSIAEHLGFLTDWYLIGPFEAADVSGFKKVYPPEQKIDLAAEVPGKSGPVKWHRYHVQEAYSGRDSRAALVNIPEALGNADDAVAYAYTAFAVNKPQAVEFRGAADDNFQVWVNGKRVFGLEEQRNGVRLDRHRFKVKLLPGVNQVLVKVVQAPFNEFNPQPNWEFLLRVVDESGNAIPMKNMLPAAK
jgi:hypothetical protein